MGRAAGSALLGLLLPRACAVCERPLDAGDGGVVCARCWSQVRTLHAPRCERCGHPRRAGECQWCRLLPAYVRAARSLCWIPGGTAGNIVHALKYGGWCAVAAEMARRMSRLSWPVDVERERTALVPVPLAPSRERERGFNQSDLLARELGRRWNLPVWPRALVRIRTTTTQTRLTPESRRTNVSGAFRLGTAPAAPLRGAHVVLVDDVVTTGATVVECARALFNGGARIVSIVTFGRAPASGDRV
ncbi:MAG: ComF family protein [Gemmatimonadaceae bacterium]